MSAATLASPAIADFPAAVRAALADLTPDEIDDLTDGLEADLTERLADGDTVELGDPVAYAEELRTAAGMPHRVKPHGGASVWAELRSLPAGVGRQLRSFSGRYSWLAGFGSFLVTLRPLWWVFRAAVIAWVLHVIGDFALISGPSVVLFLGLLVVSVQFGRGKWLPFAWMRALLLIANIVLAIATPFLVVTAATSINNASYAQSYEGSYNYSGTGLVENGSPVGNIFAYDAEGNPLTDVQLFDQDGTPLNLVGDPGMSYYSVDGTDVLVPNQSVTGRLGWNVFPLTQVSQSDVDDYGIVKPSATPSPAVAPFGTAKPLATSPAPASTAPSAIPTP